MELDGADNSNEGVFVLGATNQPWDVDSALRRPGRFDRSLVVLPPDESARTAILNWHLRERPLGALDLRTIAARTQMYSGADLAYVCETAANRALTDSVRSGTPRPIEQADLVAAISETRPSTLEWLRRAKGYAEFADDTATYRDLIDYARTHRI
jgi:SpoVK/Ycf46/Vps4 family AAA+-type ATPase